MEQTTLKFKTDKIRNIILIAMTTLVFISALWLMFSLNPQEQTALEIYRNQVEWKALQSQIDNLKAKQEEIHTETETLRAGLFQSNQ